MATLRQDVLVVEDDATLGDALCEALREEGISCTQ
jgi:DNA-binding response OmpR family regulator